MTVLDWHETLVASPSLEGHLWQATAGQAGQSSNTEQGRGETSTR
ncbi:hypothetical protein CMEL01_09485 [Colletotrichum melonis]|uniref:Uncharacterized protein n=3 Tax=Colletotrichum acutatum species complex TaxID=2707335 RepID=A0AAI9Z3K8_9PEZI|nr:uncharacterized protein CCOS01_05106 [Colletotrichum costaricense]XP_060386646.1 uncharacterized protein CTAM01_02805 [Colletotrichum tamarilloi]KAK1447646.1 hypothetical protein CMEL01_09485 [Colletotrichum melonis]KAK1507693.1 hypothetical protein CTAM01_02805 [Colletotrichum tamarilloi]KAK1533123.1 hypothetical protein CCOS01_05106 [Colletotrichum costaricense]